MFFLFIFFNATFQFDLKNLDGKKLNKNASKFIPLHEVESCDVCNQNFQELTVVILQ